MIEQEFFTEQNYQEYHVLRRSDAQRLLQAGNSTSGTGNSTNNSTSGSNNATNSTNGNDDQISSTSYYAYYYSGTSLSDAIASAGTSNAIDTMGLINAIGGAFVDVLSINPFAIDPNQAKVTIAFCCVLIFLMIVGVWHFRKLEQRDREAFELYVASRKREVDIDGDGDGDRDDDIGEDTDRLDHMAMKKEGYTLGNSLVAKQLIETQDVNSVEPEGLTKPVDAVFPGMSSLRSTVLHCTAL